MNTKGRGAPGGIGSLPAPTEETLQRFLTIQEQRLVLEVKQADIALRELDHNQKIADKSIEAQAKDRQDERMVQQAMQMHRLVFAAIVTVLVLAFVLTALWMNKDAIIMDVLKVATGFVGGIGAAALWHHRRSDQNED